MIATPPRIAGTESSGNAKTVATLINETAVSPVAMRVGSIPPATSNRYCSAAMVSSTGARAPLGRASMSEGWTVESNSVV